MTTVTTSTLVARQFLKMVEPIDPPLTQLKLMKLTYIAHGWHLGFYEKPFIAEDVLAWPHGPVFKDLYHATKGFEKNPVTNVPKSKREEFYEERNRSRIDKGGMEIVKEVNATYRDTSAWQLREMTHKPGSPWDKTFEMYGGIEDEPIIENELIREHYSMPNRPT